MNKPIRKPVFPGFPSMPEDKKYESLLSKVRLMWAYVRELVQYLDQFLSEIVALVNSSSQGVGPDLVAASTISPSWPVTHVTGTGTISTISPTAGLSGPIYLIPDGLWSTNTAGNIALGTTAVVGKVLVMVYDPGTAKFYPSYT